MHMYTNVRICAGHQVLTRHCFGCITRRALFHLTIFEDGSDLPGACWRRTSLVGISAVEDWSLSMEMPKTCPFSYLETDDGLHPYDPYESLPACCRAAYIGDTVWEYLVLRHQYQQACETCPVADASWLLAESWPLAEVVRSPFTESQEAVTLMTSAGLRRSFPAGRRLLFCNAQKSSREGSHRVRSERSDRAKRL